MELQFRCTIRSKWSSLVVKRRSGGERRYCLLTTTIATTATMVWQKPQSWVLNVALIHQLYCCWAQDTTYKANFNTSMLQLFCLECFWTSAYMYPQNKADEQLLASHVPQDRSFIITSHFSHLLILTGLTETKKTSKYSYSRKQNSTLKCALPVGLE